MSPRHCYISGPTYDVGLDGIGACETGLALLVLQDEKRTTKLVKGQLAHGRHFRVQVFTCK